MVQVDEPYSWISGQSAQCAGPDGRVGWHTGREWTPGRRLDAGIGPARRADAAADVDCEGVGQNPVKRQWSGSWRC